MKEHWRLSLGVLLLVVGYCSGSSPIVETVYGRVKGFSIGISDGKKADVFLGIPFAKPPVGELRFEKPQRPDGWLDVHDATKFKAACPPHHRSAVDFPVNEDCLYLNVMAPSEESKDKSGYAVLVWIHGGGYSIGSAVLHGYANLTNNFASRGVIAVTIQYRLGPYGFLSNGDSEFAGNIGYWDQVAALKFVRENIANFGGDPKRVTLFGLSAGGASVSALALSPHSRDLFEQGIEMSGSSFAEWALSESVVNVSRSLSMQLGCDVSDSTVMKKCLRQKSVEEIFDAVDATGPARYALNILKYHPRFDGDFFPKDLQTLLAEAPKKNTIIGLTEKEGLLFTILGVAQSLQSLYIEPEDFEKYGPNDLERFIDEVVAPSENFGDETEKVREKLKSFYMKENHGQSLDYKFYLERYTQIFSDVAFNVPALREAEMKLKHDWPVWLYTTDHYNAALFKDIHPVKGSTHVNEYPYIFGVSLLGEFLFDEDEAKVQSTILDTFANFVKTGVPNTESVKWERIAAEHPRRNLRFRVNSVVEEAMFDESISFWKSLEHFQYDTISGRPRKSGKAKDEL